ncbi:MAG TPA: prephenate dehydratase domain-containing protein [Gemmatimonadaceae bacterium]|nr:prephenate dehydratase domain-containing protein [Gemmatimonadaceae bacterium]
MKASRVAFPGVSGAFAEEGARALWPRAAYVSFRTVVDVTRAVSRGEADAGILPVENSVAGGVTAAYDALHEADDLHAVGEVILAVRQCLLAVPGTRVEDVRVVSSHPVALAQCSRFLSRLNDVEEHVASDTASAARAVAEQGTRTHAAIGSRFAAERYGLEVIAERVENRADNQTRFLGVARHAAVVEPGVPSRTSVVFETANVPGALLRVLEPIAAGGLNLSKLESRPTGEPWSYRFFADIDHEAHEAILAGVLDAIRAAARSCRVLGTYARHSAASRVVRPVGAASAPA